MTDFIEARANRQMRSIEERTAPFAPQLTRPAHSGSSTPPTFEFTARLASSDPLRPGDRSRSRNLWTAAPTAHAG